MDFEELKQNWNKACINNELLKADNLRLARELATGRAQTARDKLASYYRRSSVCAILLPSLAPALVIILDLPVWLAVLYAVFGIVMGVVNYCFARYIKNCDYTSVPTVEALSIAIKIARYQRYIRSVGIFVGCILVATMFYFAIDRDDYSMVTAFIFGLVGGLIFGTIKYIRMSALVRRMKAELQSLVEDD